MNTLILEETEHGDIPVDVYQRLANDRILFITDRITDNVAADITATMILKDFEDDTQPIILFINSNGGDIRNAFMIYDTMNLIKSPIKTICIGHAMDEAAIILAGGTKGLRFASKNSVISISQLIHDWHMSTNLIDAQNILTQSQIDNNRIFDVFSKATGKSVKQLKLDFERRVFFTPEQAAKYKLIDNIVMLDKRSKK